MKFDLAIVGNGILGLSTALNIISKDSRIKIAIIGPVSKEGSATMASGAMLNYIGEVTSHTLKNPFSRTKLEISIKAAKLWKGWLEKINHDLDEKEQVNIVPGTYVILNSKSGYMETENYDAMIAAAKEYGEPFSEVCPSAVPGINPLDDCRPLRSLFLPDEGSIDSGSLLAAIHKNLSNNSNITFLDAKVREAITDENKVSGVILDDGKKIYAEKVLLAAGSYNQDIINSIPELAKRIPPILAGLGISALVSQNSNLPIKHVIRTANRSGACGLHVTARSDKVLYVGATNNIVATPSTKQKLGLSQFLLRCAVDQIDQDLYNSEVISWSIGNRPVSLDTFPLVGKTSIDNLFILTGTYRDGLQQSPFWAEYMSEIILNDNSIIEHPFMPERDLICVMKDKEASINEVVRHYMAGMYEHDMRLARLFSEKSFEDLLKLKFEKIYDKLGTDFPFVPDILFLFELSEDTDGCIEFIKQYFDRSK